MKRAKKRPLPPVAAVQGMMAFMATSRRLQRKAKDPRYPLEQLLAERDPDASKPQVPAWDEMQPADKEIISDFGELENLLKNVTPENTCPEIDFGPPVGKEII